MAEATAAGPDAGPSWRRRLWRGVVVYAPAAVVVIGGLWTGTVWLVERSDSAAKERELAVRESRRPFLEKQLLFYFETAKVTAKLATVPKMGVNDKGPGATEDWQWAYRRFWELYWGELGVVESQEVARAMARFGSALKDMEVCATPQQCESEQRKLTGLSLSIASEMRKSIQADWGYQLPPLAK
ncbi:MAG: hypothetical protein KF889_01355 [Alphaproteobacteria bacterium]|nr:hypothetical protein [Alphaproteobacteria bacterium]MCW5741548.1 hypothetical protein [Alphaproteobacteria bacterium]